MRLRFLLLSFYSMLLPAIFQFIVPVNFGNFVFPRLKMSNNFATADLGKFSNSNLRNTAEISSDSSRIICKRISKNNDNLLSKQSCTNTSSTLNIHACNSYILNGQEFDTTGTYLQIIPNAAGCDSLITLNLSLEGYLTKEYDTACASYYWRGMSLTLSGVYSIRYVALNGCDSLFLLYLTIKRGAVSSLTQTICQGLQYYGHTTSGDYVDTLTASNGCDSVRTLHLTVVPGPVNNFYATICEGTNYMGYTQTGIYTDTSQSANGCDSFNVLHLTVKPRSILTTDVSICNGSSYFAGGALRTISGTFADSLIATNGCDSILVTNLTVRPTPFINFGGQTGLCSGKTDTLTPGNFTYYFWQDGSTNYNYIVKDTGVYWVKVTDVFNCTASDTVAIKNIYPLPTRFLPRTDTVCQNDQVIINPISSFQSYFWSTGATTSSIAATPGMYQLIVKDSHGCEGADSIDIIQKNCFTGVYLPSAFTPNNDGLNDVFRARIYGQVISFSLKVYNRFGALMFTSTNPNDGWDGSFKGKLSDAGIFVWLCSYQLQGNSPVIKKGSVALIN